MPHIVVPSGVYFLLVYGNTVAMLVRIRWSRRAGLSASEDRFRPLKSVLDIRLETIALFTAVLLTPSALVAFTMGFWIIASELRWTREFFLPHGLFSHWQSWICTAGVLLLLARLLNRFGAVDENSTY